MEILLCLEAFTFIQLLTDCSVDLSVFTIKKLIAQLLLMIMDIYSAADNCYL